MPSADALAVLELRQQLGEAVVRLVGTFLHAGRHHAIAVGNRLEDVLRHKPGLVAEGFKRRGLQRDVARDAFILECRADALWRDESWLTPRNPCRLPSSPTWTTRHSPPGLESNLSTSIL